MWSFSKTFRSIFCTHFSIDFWKNEKIVLIRLVFCKHIETFCVLCENKKRIVIKSICLSKIKCMKYINYFENQILIDYHQMRQQLAIAYNLRKNKKKVYITCRKWIRISENTIHFYENDVFSRTISRAIDFDHAICRNHKQSIVDFVDKFWQRKTISNIDRNCVLSYQKLFWKKCVRFFVLRYICCYFYLCRRRSRMWQKQIRNFRRFKRIVSVILFSYFHICFIFRESNFRCFFFFN